MGNLDRVVQHMNKLQDEGKVQRVVAFVSALERRNKRIQETARKWQKQKPPPNEDQSSSS